MGLHRDFRELLESFNAHGVEYVLVGAYALAFHGAPRYTGDLDSSSDRPPRTPVASLPPSGTSGSVPSVSPSRTSRHPTALCSSESHPCGWTS